MTITNEQLNANTDLALKLVLFSGTAALATFLVIKLKILLVCLILAVTIASAMSPLAEMGKLRRIPRLVTVLAVYIAAAAIYTLAAALLAPTVGAQLRTLFSTLPAYLADINQWFNNALSSVSDHAQMPRLTDDAIKSFSLRALQQTLDMTAGFMGLLLNSVLTLFLAAYFVVEADEIWTALFRWMPAKTRETISPLIGPLSQRMGGYIRGQLLVALSVAAFLAVGLSVAGVNSALVLGILAGILNLVPYVGSFIACAFAVVVAFNQVHIMAVYVLIVYALEQWVESSLLVPFFLGRHASLHPLIVLLAVIIGATTLGVPGALISVPIASVVCYLGEVFYASRLSGTTDHAG